MKTIIFLITISSGIGFSKIRFTNLLNANHNRHGSTNTTVEPKTTDGPTTTASSTTTTTTTTASTTTTITSTKTSTIQPTTTSTTTSNRGECPNGWIYANGECYLFHSEGTKNFF